MLVSEIIDSTARVLGLIASNESLTAFESANSLLSLQAMLRGWSSELINVNSTVQETLSLVSGTSTYTWGTGGDLDSARPNKLLHASILSSTVTSRLDILSEGEYNRISTKTTAGTPYTIFVQYTYPLANIYLYPVPNAVVTLNLSSLKPFIETDSFATLTDTLALPVMYQEPIIYNLAVRLAPQFGIEITPAIAKVAEDSYTNLVKLNSSNYIEPIKLDFPANSSRRYNINTDTQR